MNKHVLKLCGLLMMLAASGVWAGDGGLPQIRPMGPACGLSTQDWCAAPAGDACGEHATEAACRADAHCQGLPYRGESVVACMPDGKGFWKNCPAVGCVSRSGSAPAH